MTQMAERTLTVENLIAVGGSRWQHGDKDRVYINDLPRWYGLDVVRYNSGAVSGATFRGESLSNSRAKSMNYELTRGKVWFDVSTGQFMSQGLSDEMVQYITTAVRDAVEALPVVEVESEVEAEPAAAFSVQEVTRDGQTVIDTITGETLDEVVDDVLYSGRMEVTAMRLVAPGTWYTVVRYREGRGPEDLAYYYIVTGEVANDLYRRLMG